MGRQTYFRCLIELVLPAAGFAAIVALRGGIVTFRHDVRNAIGNRVMVYEILRLIADRHVD